MSFIPNCRAEYHSSLDLLAERRPAPFYLVAERDYNYTLGSRKIN